MFPIPNKKPLTVGQGEIWKAGTGELFNIDSNHSGKKLKPDTANMFNKENCINEN